MPNSDAPRKRIKKRELLNKSREEMLSAVTIVYCRIKIPKVADKNGESCISKMEKVAGQGDVHDPVEKAAP